LQSQLEEQRKMTRESKVLMADLVKEREQLVDKLASGELNAATS
jgi:hypothetical protein